MTRRGAAIVPLLLLALALAPGTAAASKPRSSPRITFYLGLERPEQNARRAWRRVTDPSSSTYREFLTRKEIAAFGASPTTRRRLRRRVSRAGLLLRIARGGAFARLSGSKAQMERYFSTRITRSYDNDLNAWTYSTKQGRVRVPQRIKGLVREVVPIYAASLKPGEHPAARGKRDDRKAREAAKPPKPDNDGTFTGCARAKATGGYSPDQLRTAYGLDALPAGAGGRVAIFNAGEGVEPPDIKAAADCYGLGPLNTQTLLTDGQRKAFGYSEPAEPQEDLMAVRAAAPQLGDVTFTQVWLIPDLWFLGPAQVYGAKQSLPDTLSISYAYCDRQILGSKADRSTRDGAKLMNSVVLRLGLAGVATFAAAGDSGSTCDGQSFPGAAWPASSPFITSVGGTRLSVDPSNHRTDEVVWNDSKWLSPSQGGGAGGGGPSSKYHRPYYQDELSNPGNTRLTPDISSHASLLPGYPVNFAGSWLADSGTSAATPLMAGAFARVSADERSAGEGRLGPVNGLLYALQRSDPSSFFDVTEGNNGLDPQVPAERAGPGYDLASGLGVPNLTAIAP